MLRIPCGPTLLSTPRSSSRPSTTTEAVLKINISFASQKRDQCVAISPLHRARGPRPQPLPETVAEGGSGSLEGRGAAHQQAGCPVGASGSRAPDFWPRAAAAGANDDAARAAVAPACGHLPSVAAADAAGSAGVAVVSLGSVCGHLASCCCCWGAAGSVSASIGPACSS